MKRNLGKAIDLARGIVLELGLSTRRDKIK